MSRPRARFVWVLPVFASIVFHAAYASVVTIDFEAYATGVASSDFMAADGIAEVSVSAGSPRVIAVGTGDNIIAGSPFNVFFQTVDSPVAGTYSMTMLFSPQLTELGLTRFGMENDASTIPAWTATLYDESGGVLGSFGESRHDNVGGPQPFTFTAQPGETIASLELASDFTNEWAYTIFVDDLILTQVDPVPAASPRLLIVLCAILGVLLVCVPFLGQRFPASAGPDCGEHGPF